MSVFMTPFGPMIGIQNSDLLPCGCRPEEHQEFDAVNNILANALAGPKVQKKVLWQSYDGRRVPIEELETTHLVNIVKTFFESNKIPHQAILEELKKRGFLTHLGNEIKPRKGYKSKQELQQEYAKRKSAPTIGTQVR